jgi:hypothetical protein
MAVELIRITIFNELFAEGEVIIGEYSPRLRLGEYSQKILKQLFALGSANIPPSLRRIIVLVFSHKSFVFFGTEFILISLIFYQ